MYLSRNLEIPHPTGRKSNIELEKNKEKKI